MLPWNTHRKKDVIKGGHMDKIVMRLHLPEPKVRKRTVRAVQKHQDKTKYTRKCKHKATGFGGFTLQSLGANANDSISPY